ncbi:LOW QUALITY PROTEIN: hypothetical protein SORBI_3001G326200 [Sorghum bicolor]|uniref:ZCF37 n=1 Tax=Sorghum bicolor TaxID=4558 RepID=A0A1Z5S8S0_SORBI|nr:LOW QUALITY PROTEIN: hypothetical protein SORBI_3001G326200 [Sorghum bicolor]
MFCECGTGSFKHVDDDDPEDLGRNGGRSPKDRDRERRKQHGGGKANPYAERGLDRFSVVLSELETRRAKILRRVGSSDTAGGLVLVRFVQSSNGDWTPVVVKLPEQPPPSKKAGGAATKKPTRAAAAAAASTAAPLLRRPPAAVNSPGPGSPREREGATAKVVGTSKSKVPARKASFSWGRRMRRPSCYWPSVIVLTLVSLAVFGRVFAICLASIWWYVLPILRSGGCYGDGAGEGVRRSPAGCPWRKRRSSRRSPLPHAKKGSISAGVYEVVRSPKGKRG